MCQTPLFMPSLPLFFVFLWSFPWNLDNEEEEHFDPVWHVLIRNDESVSITFNLEVQVQISYANRGLATCPFVGGVLVCIDTHKLFVANKMWDFQNVIFALFLLNVSEEYVSHHSVLISQFS